MAGPDPTARVLVVDDSRLVRELARDALCERVQVECCASAEAALLALEREPAYSLFDLGERRGIDQRRQQEPSADGIDRRRGCRLRVLVGHANGHTERVDRDPGPTRLHVSRRQVSYSLGSGTLGPSCGPSGLFVAVEEHLIAILCAAQPADGAHA